MLRVQPYTARNHSMNTLGESTRRRSAQPTLGGGQGTGRPQAQYVGGYTAATGTFGTARRFAAAADSAAPPPAPAPPSEVGAPKAENVPPRPRVRTLAARVRPAKLDWHLVHKSNNIASARTSAAYPLA